MSLDRPQPETDEIKSKRKLLNDVVADIRSNTGLAAIGVIGIVVWIAFQWGFGNDVLLPTITARVYNALDRPPNWSPGVVSVVASTAAGGVFWAVTQLIDALVVLTGLRLLPRVGRRFSEWLQSKYWVKPVDEMQATTRWAIAYGAGVSVLCLIDALATGQPGVARRKGLIAESIAFSAGTIAAIIAVVATATMAAQRHPALQPTAAFIARYAANPLTWIAIIAAVVGIGSVRGRSRRSG